MIDGPAYIVEWNGSESRLADSAHVRDLLKSAEAAEHAEVWVKLDRGPRRRNWIERLLGMNDRDIEPCFWLAKSGPVAALTFVDGAGSEYRAIDPDGPTEASMAQRMALSCGEPTAAPEEVCLQASRAFEAATEYLQSGERPGWLIYRYVQ